VATSKYAQSRRQVDQDREKQRDICWFHIARQYRGDGVPQRG
jgi:hypothetical protein